MFTLATRPKHQFGDPKSIGALASPSRFPQTERTCFLCKVIKVTVHGRGGNAWREWRMPGESVQLCDDFRPECVPVAQEAKQEGDAA
jgi:hypothetical protein